MSYPNGEIDEEEEIDSLEVDNNGARETRTVVKKNRFNDYYDRHWGKTWLIFGCLALFFIIFVFVWIGVYNNRYYDQDWRVQQVESRISSSKFSAAKQYVANGLYSMTAIFSSRREATLSLCHMALYKPTVVNHQEVLSHIDTLERTRLLVQRRLTPQDRGFLVNVSLHLNYNIDLGSAGGGGGPQADQLYETVHYRVQTNYGQFSTVKLLVTSEDIYKKVPRIRQEIVICSNRPGSARQCLHHTTVSQMMFMNNTLRVPMEQLPALNATQGSETVYADSVQGLRAMEQDLAANRLFHLLFYREAGDNSETLGRDDVDDYAEYLALIVAPDAC